MMMITKIRFKGRGVFKANLSIYIVPFPLKLIFKLFMLNRFKDYINYISIGLFGSILKSPRIMWLS